MFHSDAGRSTHSFQPVSTHVRRKITYAELFFTFLKAGFLGFGGFMSLISVVQTIVVERKKLLTREEILDGISLASILPGPQAVNVVAYAGNKLRGTLGSLLAAVAVILPSFLLMLLIGFLYKQFGENPQVMRFFIGFLPAVCAVIVTVGWKMAQKQIHRPLDFFLVLSAFGLLLAIPSDWRLYATFALILLFGTIGYFAFGTKQAGMANATQPQPAFPLTKTLLALGMTGLLIAGLYIPLAQEQYSSLLNLCKTFAGLSVILFGGGYVIIPIMAHHVVEVFNWLNQQTYTDAIAFSQIMPGPILIVATFIGFHVQGFLGALLSTIAIFTPPAVLMVAAAQVMDYLRHKPQTESIMKGIRIAVIALIFFAAVELALRANITTTSQIFPFLIIFATSLFVLIRYQLDLIYVIPVAGVVGYFLYP